ncbi:hypothetical protein NN561_016526 [Cricetulus griseus]
MCPPQPAGVASSLSPRTALKQTWGLRLAKKQFEQTSGTIRFNQPGEGFSNSSRLKRSYCQNETFFQKKMDHCSLRHLREYDHDNEKGLLVSKTSS